MTGKELTLTVGGKERKFFLQTGFYRHHRYKNLDFHVHSYSEVHIFLGCKARFIVGERTYDLSEGEVLMVPRECYHAYDMGQTPGSLHLTFQTDIQIDEVKIKHFPTSYLESFLREAAKMELEDFSADHARVALYLAFICGHFTEREHFYPIPVRDYAFIIREYIVYNADKNISLESLAEELCVSKKQAERLTVKHIGRTFLEELTAIRMKLAEQYIAMDESLPLTKIAALVGYQSYSGFYKAYKKYQSKK